MSGNVQMQPLAQASPTASLYNILGRNEQSVAAELKHLVLERTLVEDEQYAYFQSSRYDATTRKFAVSQQRHAITSLGQWLNDTAGSRVRFLSIPQQFSKSPLPITKTALQLLILNLNVGVDFLSVIAAFGDKPRISESGYDGFDSVESPDGSYAYCYLHRFVDRDNDDDEYQFRQIGLCHKYEKRSDTHTFILLQPHEDSRFDYRLRLACAHPDSVAEIVSDPFRVHDILLGTYFHNWRWYIKEVADEFQEGSDRVFTADIHKAAFSITFEVLQTWRDLADRIVPLTAYLAAEERIRSNLLHSTPSRPTAQTLTRQTAQLQALSSSTSTLTTRIENIISLLSNTIDIRNQTDSASLNGHLYDLTKDTVDDSTSVRIITFMTLLYLPASFTGTLFGMNLFVFDETTRRIVVGRDFWLHVVVFVPLTLVTLVGARVWKRVHDRRKERLKKSGAGGVGVGFALRVR